MMGYESSLAALLEEYAEFRAALGFSDKHATVLMGFDAYCAQFRPDAASLDEDVVRGWFKREAAAGSPGTLAHKAAAIRALARHVGGSAYVLPPDMVPKTPAFEPYIMDDGELYRFFEAVDSFGNERTDPFMPVAMRVMLRAIYACGLRPGEARRLLVGDVDTCTGEMMVRNSKHGKDRIVMAADDVSEMLASYLARRSVVSPCGAEDALFVRSDGAAIPGYQLITFVKACWKAANPGVPDCDLPRLRAYDLRHRFATEALQRWVDEGRDLYAMLPRLRAYMGHVNFKDTAYYIHLLPGRLAKSPGVDWGAVNGVGLEGGLWED